MTGVAIYQNVCDAVRQLLAVAPFPVKLSVAIGANIALPRPTNVTPATLHVYARPETLFAFFVGQFVSTHTPIIAANTCIIKAVA